MKFVELWHKRAITSAHTRFRTSTPPMRWPRWLLSVDLPPGGSLTHAGRVLDKQPTIGRTQFACNTYPLGKKAHTMVDAQWFVMESCRMLHAYQRIGTSKATVYRWYDSGSIVEQGSVAVACKKKSSRIKPEFAYVQISWCYSGQPHHSIAGWSVGFADGVDTWRYFRTHHGKNCHPEGKMGPIKCFRVGVLHLVASR